MIYAGVIEYQFSYVWQDKSDFVLKFFSETDNAQVSYNGIHLKSTLLRETLV